MTLGAEIRGATFTPVRLVPGYGMDVLGVRPRTPDVGGVLVVEKRRGLFSRVFGRGA